MDILVIDVGGTHVKLLATGQEEFRKFDSGPTMTPEEMVPQVLETVKDWNYEAVSMGYPGPVMRGRPITEPRNLGTGWVKFDYEAAFQKPVKIINDAAMQALGSYDGGKMLFLGLGTGLGSAMIIDGQIEPMELAHLPYRKRTFEDYVGERGLLRLGRKKWQKCVEDVSERLMAALQADYVVIGGGNSRKLKELPPKCRVGENANAFKGGFRLWDTATEDVNALNKAATKAAAAS
jgi:polyphosphate glucokinase